jgi:hypothetical protein
MQTCAAANVQGTRTHARDGTSVLSLGPLVIEVLGVVTLPGIIGSPTESHNLLIILSAQRVHAQP